MASQAFPVLEIPGAVYTVSDERGLSLQLRRSMIAAIFLALVTIAAIVPTLIFRIQWATILISIIIGGLIIFLWGMKVTPPLAYRRHIREIHSGLSRTVEGRLTRFDTDQLTYREGIDCYPFVINTSNDPLHPDDPKQERLLYWDAQKPFPDFKLGDRLLITAHGNDVIAYQSSGDPS